MPILFVGIVTACLAFCWKAAETKKGKMCDAQPDTSQSQKKGKVSLWSAYGV
jgi:hypothetical protein